mgnify:FL=1
MIPHLPSPPLPLRGLRILIPRGGDLGEALREKIIERGGIPTVAPLLETVAPSDASALAAAVARWNEGAYDWMVVTSATTASVLQRAGARAQPGAKTAVVGPVTAAAMQLVGFRIHVIPGRDFSGDGLAVSLLAAIPSGDRGARILLPVSELADTRLERALRDAGHEVDRVGAYSTAPAPEIPGLRATIAGGGIDVVLVTSGSAARAVSARLTPIPSTTRLAAIGRPTAGALLSAGLRADVVAELSTTDGLLDAVSSEFLAEHEAASSAAGAPTTLDPSPLSGDPS